MMQNDQVQASPEADASVDTCIDGLIDVSVDGGVDVFVYGTLRRGEINDIAQAAARHGIDVPRLIGRASIPGRLFDLGHYPGLVPLAADAVRPDAASHADSLPPAPEHAAPRVVGDVYRVVRALLPVLDEIEGIRADGRAEFYRDVCHVSVGGTVLGCLFYPIDAEAAEHRPAIEEGDWIAYRTARESARERTCGAVRST